MGGYPTSAIRTGFMDNIQFFKLNFLLDRRKDYTEIIDLSITFPMNSNGSLHSGGTIGGFRQRV